MPPVSRPQYQNYPNVFEKCVGSLKSPDRTSIDQINDLTSLSVDGVAKEGRKVAKVQPSIKPGIEPAGMTWLAVRDLTNCTNLVYHISLA